jgi:hypothetical protein
MIVAAMLAAGPAFGEVTATEAWVRGTVPAQKVTGAYMKLKSTADAKLVAAESPAAKRTEVHEMAMQGNVMQMREVGSIALPAGKVVELKPGGYHVMLMDLVKPLAKGEGVTIRLTVEDKAGKRSTVDVKAEVRAPGGSGH